MDPITLTVMALAVGASSGAISAQRDDMRAPAEAAFAKLRSLALKQLAKQGAESVMARYEANPRVWEAPLIDLLQASGAADDADLVAAAQAVLELVDANGAKSGKYNVTISNARGVQIGDSNVQVNRFHFRPSRPGGND
jgi:hypothetical protein